MLQDNLKRIFDEIANGNNLGEKTELVGATKFVDIDRVNQAISAGLSHVGENRAQEFRDKYPLYLPATKHFIGTIQQNKLKYIVGKADIIDSVSSEDVLLSISSAAQKLGTRQKIMIEINAGEEASKSGATFYTANELFARTFDLPSVQVVGIMGMLPETDDEKALARLTAKLRDFYENAKKKEDGIKYLSVGMSSDYKIAIKNGSNMIRLGTAIFGPR